MSTLLLVLVPRSQQKRQLGEIDGVGRGSDKLHDK